MEEQGLSSPSSPDMGHPYLNEFYWEASESFSPSIQHCILCFVSIFEHLGEERPMEEQNLPPHPFHPWVIHISMNFIGKTLSLSHLQSSIGFHDL